MISKFKPSAIKIKCNGVDISVCISETERKLHNCIDLYCDNTIDTNWIDERTVMLSCNGCTIKLFLAWEEGYGEYIGFTYSANTSNELVSYLYSNFKIAYGLTLNGTLLAYPEMITALIIQIKEYLLSFSIPGEVRKIFNNYDMYGRFHITVDDIEADPVSFTECNQHLAKTYARSLI